MAVKLTEQTNGPHIFMRLRLDSGRVEEIDAYISEEGWRYVKGPQAIKLTPACAFMEIFCGARKTLPLSSARYPISLVAYSRSDYDGWRWWTTWFPDEEMRPAPELGQEIDAFQSQLLALPEFKTLWAMERMCRLYAQPTKEPTEFNLYAETAHFHIWLRLITRERDYNLYTYFFAK